jgi:hypothetical protein
MQIDKQSQDSFFEQLGAQLTRPATVYVFGGTCLICLDMPGRLTDDIDAFSAGDAALAAALQASAERNGIKVDDLDVSAISETPSALAEAPTLYRQFGPLTVMILDPHLTAIGKLDRAGEGDVRDLFWLRDQNLLDFDRLELLLDGAKHLDDRAASIALYNRISGRNKALPEKPPARPPPKRKRRLF